jgi:hypothetical protein
MTTVVDPEIDGYLAAVSAALADLPGAVRGELLEDLPDHLAEVRAESGERSLTDVLGTPAAYAAELRSAAGHPVAGSAPDRRPLPDALVRVMARFGTADRAIGEAFGGTRASDAVRAFGPGWWVLRGWIVALVIAGAFRHAHWTGLVPRVDGSPDALGWLLGLAAVAVSVAVGAWSRRRSAGTRFVIALASVAIAVFGIFVTRNLLGADVARYGGPGVNSVANVPTPAAPSGTP